jgi:ribose transport system permease protein
MANSGPEAGRGTQSEPGQDPSSTPPLSETAGALKGARRALTPRLASAEGAGRAGTAWKGVQYGATLVGFAVMFLIFYLVNPVFGSWENIRSILQLSAPILVLAAGLTVVLTTGEFDLAFPGIVAIAAVGAVQVMADGGGSAGTAVVVGIAIGIGGGFVGGLLVAAQRASSFIVTLALQGIWSGLALGFSGNGGSTITDVSQGYLDLTFRRVDGVPLPVIYAAVIAFIAFAVVRWTIFGRQAESIGENPGAARLAGIRVSLVKIGAFTFMGACSGIAAVMLSSQTGQFTPDLSSGLFIPPFVACFFGISVLAAGRFNIVGTVVGALFVATLETGLTIAGFNLWVGDVIVGAALLVILFIASQSREAR